MNKLVSTIVSSAIAAAAPAAYAGISGGGDTSSAQAQLLLVGPVDAINTRASVVTVLGQKVHYPAAGTLVLGDAVSVFGRTNADGSFVATKITDKGQYVPGATLVVISGKVQKADPAVGRVMVDGLTIDLTGTMSSGAVAPAAGTDIKVIGIQPIARGLVVASGISGGGLGISGGGLGISGGGLGISGGGLGISGGGLGISGGGLATTRNLGISGGGHLGISGGGLGISGGGLGISGGGLATTRNLGISGGGHLGISGGGLGISGGGLGISGGGLGISGGGKP